MKQVLTFLLLLSCIPTWSQSCSITLNGTPVGDTLEVCLSDTLTLGVASGFSNCTTFSWTLDGDTVSSTGNVVAIPPDSLQAPGTLQLVVVGIQNGSNSETCCTNTVQIIPVTCGCTDPDACNYDGDADSDNDSCTYPEEDYLDCDGNCLNDADGDGICDELEVGGCTDPEACNYDMAATDDDGSCTYPAADNLDCDGNCLNDADMDGVCDEDEIAGCTDTEAANYDADATDDDGSCTYGCAPEWGMPITLPSVATVLALITVDGENAAMEDQVGAFVNGELRGTGDIIDYEGATYVSMTVYLAGGEEMIDFVLFNEDECATCTMDAELTVTGFGEYGSFDAPLMFDANCSATTLEVNLMEGWNYVSTNLIPEDYGISTLFEDALDGALLKVLGDDNFALGQSYTPGIPSVFNSLQMHTDGAGYVIKVNADAIWTSTGSPLEAASTPLDLNEGWNIVGYVPQIAMGVEEALAAIDGVVGTVIDGQNGTVWNPANPNEFNSLLDLEPGRSYWVRMLEAATLTYPEGTAVDGGGMVLANTKSDGEAAESMTGWSVERAPGAAALAAEILVNGLPVDGEAYLGAFVDNACVAVRPVINAVQTTAAQMAVMLNGPSEVQFKLWLDGVVFDAENVLTMEGGDEFGQGGAALPVIHFTSATNGMATAQWVSGLDIHPVPAQNEAWLTLNLMQAEQVRIAVLDARGGEVAVIHDGALAAGEHRLMLAVQGWAAGTYFLRGTGKSGTFHDRFIVR